MKMLFKFSISETHFLHFIPSQIVKGQKQFKYSSKECNAIIAYTKTEILFLKDLNKVCVNS